MNDSSNLIFIDSSIWYYSLTKTLILNTKSKIAMDLINNNKNIVISPLVINELCQALLKNSKIFENQIEEIINSMYNRYIVAEQNKPILIKASHLRKYYSFSYKDSIIASTAIHANCKIMYSEFLENELIVDSQLKVINPFL